ncbi:hypothetical protein GS461_07085 [Rhodococcus hoagii]|nr:hypothetical protein [Prescottella equi]
MSCRPTISPHTPENGSNRCECRTGVGSSWCRHPPRRAWRPPRYWDPRSPRRGRFERTIRSATSTPSCAPTALAFADRDRYLADPAFHEVPTSEILDPEYLAACAARTQATGIVPPEKLPRAAGDTTFSCAVDAQGNVAAVVQSLYWEWGSACGRETPACSCRIAARTSHWTRATATACSPASDPPAR